MDSEVFGASFFRALAHDQRDRCAAVILSSRGEGGAAGVRSIRGEHGGRLGKSPGDKTPAEASGATAWGATDSDSVEDTLPLPRERTGRVFRCFRRPMPRQSILRRMAGFGLTDMTSSLAPLNGDRIETGHLSTDPMIGDTRFFRDPDAFAALAERMDSLLLRMCRHDDSSLRVWVPGCATGEEAYSIAMVLLERMARLDTPPPLLVFATDIDPAALATGRAGAYPDSVAADIPPERLEKFFSRDGTGFRVGCALRRVVIFSEQDLVVDPPFAEIDLISCRNLLIHMEPAAQRHVLSLFRFALNNDGVLFLGKGETPEQSPDLFVPLDLPHRIYARSATLRRFPVAVPMSPPPCRRMLEPSTARVGLLDYAELTRRLLSGSSVSAAVLVDRKSQPLHYSGPIDLYLDFSAGHTNVSLVTMARYGLKGMLRRLIHQATRLIDAEQVSAIVRFKRNGVFVPVHLSVLPAIEPKRGEFLLLVCFADGMVPSEPPDPRGNGGGGLAWANQRMRAAGERTMPIDANGITADCDPNDGRNRSNSTYDNAITDTDARRFWETEAQAGILADVLHDSNDAVIVVGPEGRILAWNRMMTELCGYQEDEAVGMVVSALAPPENLKEMEARYGALFRGEVVPTSFETHWLNRSGDRMPVWVTVTPLHDTCHRIVCLVSTVRDIRERKALLQSLESMNGALETMVRTRTEKLETSNHDLEEFAYVISHDLQEPLRMVTSYLKLIERRYHEKLDAEANQFIEFAVDGAKRMQSMIRGLLELSRIGKDSADFVAVVPLGIPLDNAQKALAQAIEDNEARIEVQTVLPSVLGNEVCLGRLFQNLIGNAIKYRHPDRAPLIRVEVDEDRDDASLWRIAVIDNGIGIPAECHERVFGIFQRLHTSDKVPGTGIGLATARKIVTNHGGRIWVESNPSGGCTFCFTLHGPSSLAA